MRTTASYLQIMRKKDKKTQDMWTACVYIYVNFKKLVYFFIFIFLFFCIYISVCKCTYVYTYKYIYIFVLKKYILLLYIYESITKCKTFSKKWVVLSCLGVLQSSEHSSWFVSEIEQDKISRNSSCLACLIGHVILDVLVSFLVF